MKTVPTPAYITQDYVEVAPTRLIEDGPRAGKYAHCVPMIYTIGIMVSTPDMWECRWCYSSRIEAIKALEVWDGQGDPSGPWIKYKGIGGERHGPGSTVPEELRK